MPGTAVMKGMIPAGSPRAYPVSTSSSPALFTPRIHDDLDQGDPFLLHTGVRYDYRYYCYTTAAGDAGSGWAFAVYGSQDLRTWTYLRNALRADPSKAYWAPCVWRRDEGPYHFMMLYSHAVGTGVAGHVGHRIYAARSALPEGPYETFSVVTPSSMDFAIDPDLSRTADGRLMLTFAADFNEGPHLGTGIWEAEIREDFEGLAENPRPIARPHYDWQLFDANRCMPWKRLDGVDWGRGDRVRWYCMEAPASITSPNGSRLILYSGGNFEGSYGVGVLRYESDGAYHDLTKRAEECLIKTTPEHGLFGPGHGSFVKGVDGNDYFGFHARFGAPDAPRVLSLARVSWERDMPVLTPA